MYGRLYNVWSDYVPGDITNESKNYNNIKKKKF